MSSPESPAAAAALRRLAIANLTRSSTPEPARAGAARAATAVAVLADVRPDGALVSVGAATKADRLEREGSFWRRVSEVRATLAVGLRTGLGTGRGRWVLIGLKASRSLRAGRGPISSTEGSISNGVRRRLARSPNALAAPAANASSPRLARFLAPDPPCSATTLGSAISRSFLKRVGG